MRLQSIRKNRNSRRAIASTVPILLATVVLLGLNGLPLPGAQATTFNVVQVFVSTSESLQYNYLVSAYNLSGNLVGTYQSSYPAAAFELPAGSYLFTVSALRQGYPSCPMCAQPMMKGSEIKGNASGGTSNGTSIVMPIRYYQPASEYGYRVEPVSGPVTFTIQTKNVTLLPTSPVTVKVTYANGTAAAGASVSASIVGQDYYWWSPNSSVVMSNQTNEIGIAHLVLPQAPAVVTAWDWVPVNLPASNKTVRASIGGETINVTVYWQPTYVGLSASAMVIPPETSVSLTLHYQQPQYWIMPMGAKTGAAYSSGVSDGVVASQPSGVPTTVQSAPSQTAPHDQYYLPSTIPPIRIVGSTTESSPTSTQAIPAWNLTAIAVGSTAAVLATGAAIVVLRTRSHHKRASP